MRRAVCFALALGAASLAATPLPAQRSLVFESFHSDIRVEPSGEIVVTETLRPRFSGQWNGIVRILDLTHTTAAGERETLDVRLLSATDSSGRELRSEVNPVGRSRREFRVWVPDARDRTAEVVLRYQVDGALRFFAGDTVATDADPAATDYDELYWQVTGTEWEVPLEEATARVVLPSGAGARQAAAYRGSASSTDQVEVALPGPGVDLAPDEVVVPTSAGALRPGEGLTIAVAWPAGSVALPPGTSRARPVSFGPTGSVTSSDSDSALAGASYWGLLPLLLPLLVFWLTYRAWVSRGRDPRERAITVQWEPPTGLGPAEAGTLVDNHPGMHDIIGTLVDLAVRGYVVIAEREKKGFLRLGKDYALHLVRPRADWSDLAAHERRFLDGLFKGSPRSEVMASLAEEGSFLDGVLETIGGEAASSSAPDAALQSVLLSDLQNEFYKELPGIREALLDSLVSKGHYQQRPDKVRARWGLIAAGLFILAFTSVFAFAVGTGTAVLFGGAIMVASAISAVMVGIFALVMPARTEHGARTREAALGFKRFLERVESPRYRRMITSPDQFERHLPYAVAFRCAEKWAKAFDDLLTEPPQWYHGTSGHFLPTAFASDLGTLASTAGSTLASSPSSSGSSGGGSVSGGSGGGGGGGF